MNFSDIKAGDLIRVTTPARTTKGFGPARQVPERTVTMKVQAVTVVNGEPGRQQAWGVIAVTENGEVLPEPALTFPGVSGHLGQKRGAEYRPSFSLFSDCPLGETFERA